MIATRREIKDILQIPYTELSSGDLVDGVEYEILSNTTGDFSNLGAPDNLPGTKFVCVAEIPTPPDTEPILTPADWGVAVLLETQKIDTLIDILIPFKQAEIFSYCNNRFEFGEGVELEALVIGAHSLTDATLAINYLQYNDVYLAADSPNEGNYTIESKTAGVFTIAEELIPETIPATLYNVHYPKELKLALAYMMQDDIEKQTHSNVKSESIRSYSATLGGDKNFPYNNYVRSILDRYKYNEVI